ncbi:MAG: 30S ribosomal protein S16, partial [Candidatus Cloacimonadota bacterium]
ESLGYYDPKTDPFTLKVDVEKSLKWLKVGAQPSDTVRSLFKKAGVLEKWHNIRYAKKAETEIENPANENEAITKPEQKDEKEKTDK